jgi:uncharacterized protein YfaQ (DUF2300 family)
MKPARPSIALVTLSSLSVVALSAAGPRAAGGRVAGDLAVAWLRDGRVTTRTTDGAAAPTTAPLGSVWKLFVYAYAVERGVETPAYRCGPTPTREDAYCCEPGQAIDRDRALARSCGRFFEPHRLGIDAVAWRAFWASRASGQAAWLADLKNLRPATQTSREELLHALAAVPSGARVAAERALLPIVIDGYGRGGAAHLGGLLRAKTFTWDDPDRPGASLGGGAGWLVDGTPIWFAAPGSSTRVLADHAARLATWLPAPQRPPLEEPCVVVRFFERYPIRAVDRLASREPAQTGPLEGRYRVLFENGNALTFAAASELALERQGSRTRIVGRFPLSEYVARVLDREADATVPEAARALAIVARTWTHQNAPFERGCFQVADSTRMQRVSANAPTAAARASALFTDGLVLQGESVAYHRDQASPGVLSWTSAVAQARAGRSFDRILADAFPRASLAAVTGERECRRLQDADAWLARTSPAWRRRLAAQAGFESPETLAVCGLDYGNPYADRARARIYVRGITSREDRIAVAHEYVHLAFRFHPRGSDEGFVETVARTLVDVSSAGAVREPPLHGSRRQR